MRDDERVQQRLNRDQIMEISRLSSRIESLVCDCERENLIFDAFVDF